MRASLVQREPARLAHWEKIGLYEAIQQKRAAAPAFVLHDGPPFTNGDVHIGTALNKTLKDIILRYKSMRGFRTPYVPGWDCHGLPDRAEGHARAPGEETAGDDRRAAPAVRRFFRDVDREAESAVQAPRRARRLGARVQDQGPGLRGRHPAHLRRVRREGPRLPQQEAGLLVHPLRNGARRGRDRVQGPRQPVDLGEVSRARRRGGEVRPARGQAALHRHLDDHAVDAARQPRDRACTRRSSMPSPISAPERITRGRRLCSVPWPTAAKLRGRAACRAQAVEGAKLEHLQARHPFIDRASPVVLADYVTTDSGTGCVHTAPGPRPRGLPHRPQVRPRNLLPGRRRRPLPRRRPHPGRSRRPDHARDRRGPGEEAHLARKHRRC